MFRRKKPFVEYHKYTVIEPMEEIYPETNRKLIRPKINFWLAGLKVFLTLLCVTLLSWGGAEGLDRLEFLSFGLNFFLLFLVLFLISLLIFAKNIVIFVIRVYQRYAPYEIRSKCLFIPNCSEYMILAIQKYGLIPGIKKGFDRYSRCHAPNGGEDYP